MAKEDLDAFRHYREKMNSRVIELGNLDTKRFFNLDGAVYNEGGNLSVKVRELLGFVASLVLRCDDCITYHVVRAVQEGVTQEEFIEASNIGMIVGGSIVIPHFRRAIEMWDQCQQELASEGTIDL